MQQIESISLLGNRLTGSIPKQIGSLSTLRIFTVEFNNLSGTLPPELGNLAGIENLHFTSNYFTGELPPEFARLTSLKDFRISDNQFTGKIPNFIQNWTNLEKLLIQASGLMGPIPSNINALAKLTDLRISDLNGTDPTKFPQLTSRKLKTLILRSCNIVDKLPDYLGKMTSLTTLDLSFNNLSGEIPLSFMNLMETTNYIYLTGNLLSGIICPQILESGKNVDLSYNNFTPESTCPQQRVNLFASYPGSNEPGVFSCLGRSECQKTRYHLYINCGGDKVVLNKTIYEEDTDQEAASKLVVHVDGDWALSSTGHFNDKQSVDRFTLMTNAEVSIKDSELYKSARLSAISLTYYAFCMGNGNYTVNLHFAEIRFTDDKTYSSLGRRVFDIYIQMGWWRNDIWTWKLPWTRRLYSWEDQEESEFLKEIQETIITRGKTDVWEWIHSKNGEYTTRSAYKALIMEHRLEQKGVTLQKNEKLPLLIVRLVLGPSILLKRCYSKKRAKQGDNTRFTDDKTYSSLGRRVFDIYIQGKLVQKDFNIVDEAGGVGKAIIKNFSAAVTKGTLEIRLYWAGKGTTDIPVKGVYGPLISAISVNPNFIPPSKNWSLVVGVLVLVGAAFALLLIFGIVWWKRFLGQKNTLEQDLKGLGLQTGSFSLRQIKAATNNFDLANKIGEGGFGPVYKGQLTDGKAIAVKQLSAKSKQGNREFVNEIGMISAVQHPHLVKLYGCCIEGNQLLLIYEYMENNSLA
ncbi:hypothetical protein SLEP1_g59574, partial [Rubroshorea leprosula]